MRWESYLLSLLPMLGFGLAGWVISVWRHNVTLVDSMWSLFFLLAGSFYFYQTEVISDRTILVFALLAVWALRLSIYLTLRNSGKAEDHRYQTIRSNNQPGFWWKSFYIIFVFQAILAWLISLPLAFIMPSTAELGLLDTAAILLWAIGFFWESVADWQLSRFKADPNNKGKVMKQGLWKLSRHPNYFGEFCIWWSFYLFACAAGGWWSLISPLLMTFLLLKFSGVVLLEKDIAQRRPEYIEYIKSTPAFFPRFNIKLIK